MLNSISNPTYLSSLKTQNSATSSNMRGMQHPINRQQNDQQSYQPNFQGIRDSISGFFGSIRRGVSRAFSIACVLPVVGAPIWYFVDGKDRIQEKALVMAVEDATGTQDNPGLDLSVSKNRTRIDGVAQAVTNAHDSVTGLYNDDLTDVNNKLAKKYANDIWKYRDEISNPDSRFDLKGKIRDFQRALTKQYHAVAITNTGVDPIMQEGNWLNFQDNMEKFIVSNDNDTRFLTPAAKSIQEMLEQQILYNHEKPEEIARILKTFGTAGILAPLTDNYNKTLTAAYAADKKFVANFLEEIHVSPNSISSSFHKKPHGIGDLLAAEAEPVSKSTRPRVSMGNVDRVIRNYSDYQLKGKWGGRGALALFILLPIRFWIRKGRQALGLG